MTRALVIAVLATIVGSATGAFVAVATTMLVGRPAIEADDEADLNDMFEEDPPPSTQHDAHGFFAPQPE